MAKEYLGKLTALIDKTTSGTFKNIHLAIKKDYVILPKGFLSDVNILQYWVKVSIEHVASLPQPIRKKRQ